MNKSIQLIRLILSYKIIRSSKLNYPPYQFTIEPTNQCNLKCDFCPQSDPQHHQSRAPGMLTLENFENIFQKMKASASSNRNINFTLDGEPFLNKSFLKFVKVFVEIMNLMLEISGAKLLDKSLRVDQIFIAKFAV